MKTRLSKKYSIGWSDALRGLLIAVITAVITVLENSISAGDFNFDLSNIAKVGATAAVGYIFKNLLFEPPKVITTVSSNSDAVDVEDAINQNI